ncbi:MAG: hypothetical protein ACI9JZ_002926, partial [Lentimonas sp.]
CVSWAYHLLVDSGKLTAREIYCQAMKWGRGREIDCQVMK